MFIGLLKEIWNSKAVESSIEAEIPLLAAKHTTKISQVKLSRPIRLIRKYS